MRYERWLLKLIATHQRGERFYFVLAIILLLTALVFLGSRASLTAFLTDFSKWASAFVALTSAYPAERMIANRKQKVTYEELLYQLRDARLQRDEPALEKLGNDLREIIKVIAQKSGG